MDEAEKETTRKEALKILEKFSKSLKEVKIKSKSAREEAGGYREEGAGEKGDLDFRKRMFANAPEKDEDCIIAEKKKW